MIAWLLAAALAAAPVAPDAPVAATAPGIDPAPAVPTPEQVMALPPPLAQALRTQVVDRTPRGMARLERLVAFMYEPDGLGIQYRHDANHTVAETWATREANCLSFTLLFVVIGGALYFFSVLTAKERVFRAVPNVTWRSGSPGRTTRNHRSTSDLGTRCRTAS